MNIISVLTKPLGATPIPPAAAEKIAKALGSNAQVQKAQAAANKAKQKIAQAQNAARVAKTAAAKPAPAPGSAVVSLLANIAQPSKRDAVKSALSGLLAKVAKGDRQAAGVVRRLQTAKAPLKGATDGALVTADGRVYFGRFRP